MASSPIKPLENQLHTKFCRKFSSGNKVFQSSVCIGQSANWFLNCLYSPCCCCFPSQSSAGDDGF
ncbi:MAG TPA: hypothetical protein V6C91_06335, partial [Coleofasciculaceae cyanobacterium]